MAEGYELDLTYVTERIICVSFPQDGLEEVYLRDLRDVTRMLRSKHADTYLVINLSERKQELRKMNPKTLDAGWPDLHAPPLDKICTICKAMEKWLNAAPLHVVVIHCRGGKGRIGVVISSFVHFTDVSASADQALDRFAMRRFYEDKVSALMTPSQKRYVWILRSLLSGSVKMNTSAAFLHCVCVREVPVGASQLYVKVYQGMQVVHVSGFHHVSTGHRGRIFFILDPAQPLKGDVMVKCFQLSSLSVRRLMFRVQFHIGTVQSCSLEFQRDQMDQVHPDCRFPASASVELLLSDGPEQMSGSEYWNNGPGVTVDYTNTDPLSRCDSYQNICGGEAPSVPRAQPEESRSRESESPAGWGPETPSSAPEGSCVRGGLAPRTSSPDHTLFSSSDSGLSSTSLRTDSWSAAGPRGPQPSRQEKMELRRMLSGFGLEEPAQDQASLPPPPDQFQENGQPRPRERETDILDDEALSCHHDLRSTDSLGTLSSSYHKSSQNSLLSDGLTEDTPQGHSEYGRRAGVTQKTQTFQQGGYPTQSWVHQQQLQYPYLPEEDLHPLKSASPPHKSHDEEFSSLTLDIDNSIRQLNQLILDLDPTLVSSTAQPERTLMGTGDWRVRAARALPREEDVLLSKNRTDVAELSGQSFWAAGQRFSNTCVTHADLYRTDDAEDDGIDVMMPSTPAFPTSPRTPYVRNVVNFSSYTPQSRSCAAEEDQDDVTGFPRVMRTADSSSSDPDLSRCLSGSLTFSARSLPVPELFTSSAGFQRVPSDGENSQNSSRSNSSLSAPFPCSVSEQPTPAHASRPSLPLPDVLSSRQLTVKFVQDTSRYWYKPGISRDQAIAVLKERAPGSFMVRDSHSFRGAYGLAVKVSTPPASTLPSRRGADPSCELVRHFLIECTQKGVRLKGCPTEPFFGSLSALVYQHSISALALPCKLLLPDRDPLEDAVDVGSSSSVSNSAAELLKQGAACNVWFLGSVEMESLTGSQAVLKAVDQVLGGDSSALSTLVHFKVSTQGITLTDNQRKLFFRRHYSVSTVIYCGLDPQDRRWKTDSDALAKIFGFVARKTGRGAENVCHLFGELDPEQPASAIVNFISRVMMGQKP